jgi:hypothetical protein
MTSALAFLERHHKEGNEFLSHIVRVTGDETWVSFMNVETKDQSKQWMICSHSYTHPHKYRLKLYMIVFLGPVIFNSSAYIGQFFLIFLILIRGSIQKFRKYSIKNYYLLPGFYSAPSPSK